MMNIAETLQAERIVPGIATASELTCALNAGLQVVKFFPAEAVAGSRWDEITRLAADAVSVLNEK